MLLLTEENTFLQEALRKNRVELENEKRQHKSLKQNKVRSLLFSCYCFYPYCIVLYHRIGGNH